MADDPDAVAAAFLAHRQMEEQAAYLNRGRAYAGLMDDDLDQRWADAFRGLVKQGGGPCLLLDDLGAEITLRGREWPNGLVQDAMDQLVAEMKKAQGAGEPFLSPNGEAQLDEFLAARRRGN